MLVAGKELRETLRDRRTLAVMVLFPLVVYPLVSLATVQVLTARIGRGEKVRARGDRGPARSPTSCARASPRATTARRRLRAVARGRRPPPTMRAGSSTRAIAVDNGARRRGAAARRASCSTRRRSARATRARGSKRRWPAAEPGCAAPTRSPSRGGAAQRDGRLPAVEGPAAGHRDDGDAGRVPPAIDITAGERERGTLETTLSAPIARAALMAGKVVAVATLAALFGRAQPRLDVDHRCWRAQLARGLRIARSRCPWPARARGAAGDPAGRVPVRVGDGRDRRARAQLQGGADAADAGVFLCMAPSLLAALGDFELTAAWRSSPASASRLLARDVIAGHASIGRHAGRCSASSVAYGAAALAVACRCTIPSACWAPTTRAWACAPGSATWCSVPRRAPARDRADAPPTAGQALALFGVAVVLLFAFAPLQSWRLAPGLALFQWVGLLGLTAVYARGSGVARVRSCACASRRRRRSRARSWSARRPGWSSVCWPSGCCRRPRSWSKAPRRDHAAQGPGAFALALLLTAVTPAICEEALFRGPILRGLRTRFSPLGSAILTGLLFGLFHGSVWRFLPTALLGFALSAIALAADSIVPAMIAHFANNACIIALVTLGADSSASTSPKLRLLLIAIGAAWVTAGGLLLARAQRSRNLRTSRQMTLGIKGCSLLHEVFIVETARLC
jgi:membrane protease YdiL (CAAX protease family)